MGDQYGLPDLRQLIAGRNHLHTHPHLPEPLSVHDTLGTAATAPPSSYDPIMVGDVFSRGFTHFAHDYSSSANPTTNPTVTATASDHATAFCSIETEEKGWLGFDAGNNRWPRQETLSLLEIRSRLDSKFRETNQKGPLWNEISRIMGEEYGYQRSGKKCKEKFENLYKYYKKTKEGKAGRQDGKHYRFFRQLEAICRETSAHASTSETHHAGNTSPLQTPSITINQDSEVLQRLKCSKSLSLSNSSEFETSSSENNDEDLSAIAYMMKQSREKQKEIDYQRESHGHERVRKSWRAKVEELVDSHMRKIIETQDAWMEKMMSVIEQREQEMAFKEEERKKKDSMRFDQKVHELWAKERAWVEARDAELMDVVKKHLGKELAALPLAEPMAEEPQNKNNRQTNDALDYPSEEADHSSGWTELEISNLIQLRTGFELRFQESGYLENGFWDEIAAKMACLGFDRSATECKKIWGEISISLNKTMECGSIKTRSMCVGLQLTEDDLSHSSSNAGTRGYLTTASEF